MSSSHRIAAHDIDLRLRSTMAMGQLEATTTPPDAGSAGSSGSGVFPNLEHPKITQTSIMSVLATPGMPIPEQPRHQVQELLGMGATGEVFAVQDRNLERIVAVKIIPPEQHGDRDAILHLIEEARITASLAHPNVLPVYDLDLDTTGRAYFSMKRIEGRSLGDAITQSTWARRDPAISSDNAVVTIFIGISQALAYAHRHGIVHQDIKPENVMLGEYGEVLVVDWGSAERLRTGSPPRLYGTPLYMSPEQARNENVDERSDVYCLGATLLHVLLLRLPTWSEEVDEFWRKKRLGELDPITAAERQATPPALLSITTKALARDPAQRYPHAGAMLADLQAYQAGLRVSAHRDSVLERMRRWHRRHGRQLWISVLVAGLVAALAGVIYAERLKELATWGSPQVVEDFTSDAWRTAWVPRTGSFAREGDQLVSQHERDNIIYLNRKFAGPTAVEYDAVMQPSGRAGDISLVWAPELTFNPAHTQVIQAPVVYNFQVGANDDSYTLITLDQVGTSHKQTLSYAPLRPSRGQLCHVRAEIADNQLRLWVNGELACTWKQPFSFSSGYVGLYGFYPKKAFSHIRIYSRGVPQRVKATAIGDYCVQNGNLPEAISQYAWIAHSNPGTAVGLEAAYKQGLCESQQGEVARAFATWKQLRSTSYAPLITLQDIDHIDQSGSLEPLLHAMRSFYQSASTEDRELLAQQWGRYEFNQIVASNLTKMQQLMEFHDQEMRSEHTQDIIATQALLLLGRNQEILDHYPNQRMACASAYVAMGNFEGIVEHYSDQMFPISIAAYTLGLSNVDVFPHMTFFYGMMLWNEGRFAEARAVEPDQKTVVSESFMAEGRFNEALAVPKIEDGERAFILCAAGRFSEVPRPWHYLAELEQGRPELALANAHDDRSSYLVAEDLVSLRRLIQGETLPPDALSSGKYGQDPREWSPYSFDAVAVPFIHDLQSHQDRLTPACETLITKQRWWNRQRAYYQASFLLGRITEAQYLKHPWCLYAPAELLLLKAMLAERHQDHASALADYQAWTAMPAWKREYLANPCWQEFVAWRMQVLATPVPPQTH